MSKSAFLSPKEAYNCSCVKPSPNAGCFVQNDPDINEKTIITIEIKDKISSLRSDLIMMIATAIF